MDKNGQALLLVQQCWAGQPRKKPLLQGNATAYNRLAASPSIHPLLSPVQASKDGDKAAGSNTRILVTSTTWASFSHLLRTFCMSWKTCCRTTTTCEE